MVNVWFSVVLEDVGVLNSVVRIGSVWRVDVGCSVKGNVEVLVMVDKVVNSVVNVSTLSVGLPVTPSGEMVDVSFLVELMAEVNSVVSVGSVCMVDVGISVEGSGEVLSVMGVNVVG